MKKLTPKQQVFVDEYLISLNATQSAIKAGYSKKTADKMASKLVVKSSIQKAIQSRLQEKQSERIMKQDELLELWTSIARNSEEDTRNRLKASELLGKRYALFTENINLTNCVKIKVTVKKNND